MPPNRILIVEDDEGIREITKLGLELAGYSVATAKNGADGIKILTESSAPCLILLDLMMPEMNGWEFIEKLRENSSWSKLPVLVVTAFSDHAKEIQGTIGVLKKPITYEALLRMIERHCNKISESMA